MIHILIGLHLGNAQQRHQGLVHELRVVVAHQDTIQQIRVQKQDHHVFRPDYTLHDQFHLLLDCVGEYLAQNCQIIFGGKRVSLANTGIQVARLLGLH